MDYQDAERETGNDGVFNGEGGELESSDVAGEGLSDGAEGVLTKAGEDGGGSEVPELSGFDHEFSGKISESGDWGNVIGICDER